MYISYVCMNVYMDIYHMYVCTYVCICVCMHTYMCMYVYIHTYCVLNKPPIPYITSSPLCLLRGFTSYLNFGS